MQVLINLSEVSGFYSCKLATQRITQDVRRRQTWAIASVNANKTGFARFQQIVDILSV